LATDPISSHAFQRFFIRIQGVEKVFIFTLLQACEQAMLFLSALQNSAEGTRTSYVGAFTEWSFYTLIRCIRS